MLFTVLFTILSLSFLADPAHIWPLWGVTHPPPRFKVLEPPWSSSWLSTLHWLITLGVFNCAGLLGDQQEVSLSHKEVRSQLPHTHYTLFSYSTFCHPRPQIAKARRGGQAVFLNVIGFTLHVRVKAAYTLIWWRFQNILTFLTLESIQICYNMSLIRKTPFNILKKARILQIF